jgi:hypothetical protein
MKITNCFITAEIPRPRTTDNVPSIRAIGYNGGPLEEYRPAAVEAENLPEGHYPGIILRCRFCGF